MKNKKYIPFYDSSNVMLSENVVFIRKRAFKRILRSYNRRYEQVRCIKFSEFYFDYDICYEDGYMNTFYNTREYIFLVKRKLYEIKNSSSIK